MANRGLPSKASKGKRGQAVHIMFPADGDLDRMINDWLADNKDFTLTKKGDNSHLPKPHKWALFQRGAPFYIAKPR